MKQQAIILTKLDGIENAQSEVVAQNKIRNGRLEKLETKMAYVFGGIALLSALGVSNLITWAGI